MRARTDAGAGVKAYSPSHITGIFAICDDRNPLYKGSIGCGIVLEAGCVTEVSVDDMRPGIRIEIEGVEGGEASTTEYVCRRMAGEYPIRVSSRFEVPIGAGFGASGAGALSTALALNARLSLGMTLNEVAQIAHLAEVENNTGLGDVIAETYGGVVIRKKPGPPGIGMVDKIILPPEEVKISYVTFGVKATREILRDASIIRSVNEAGRAALKELLKKPDLDTFMRAARDFSLQTGLMSERCRDAIEAVEAEGKVASVAMLGETVFVPGDSEALREFGEVRQSRISYSGARIIHQL
ncbi:MAG: hypothetical protein J7I99_01675 [Methanophagales archaeon]|nr:hypothetical protein [Methanophagales archaeon]